MNNLLDTGAFGEYERMVWVSRPHNRDMRGLWVFFTFATALVLKSLTVCEVDIGADTWHHSFHSMK